MEEDQVLLPSPPRKDYSELAKLSPTHEAIMDWILLNPGATLAECANVFRYTPQGIGYIVNSDCFRAKLRERRDTVELLIAADIPSKLGVLGALAVERTTDVLNKTNDPDLIVDIFDKTLHKLGYAPTKGPGTSVIINNQPTQFTASIEDIAQAQAIMLQAGKALPMLVPAVVGEPRPALEVADE
jgi:hypothetical protein